MTRKTFAYRPNMIKMFLITLVFALLSSFAALGSHHASGPRVLIRLFNSMGLDINQVIKLVGFLGMGMSLVALAMLVYAMFATGRSVSIGDGRVRIPGSIFSSKVLEVRTIDIHDVSLIDVFGQKIIRLNHLAGTIDMPSSMFPDKQTFDDCFAALSSVR